MSGDTLKPRDCIICGKPAGSAEHVFPSALGGHRTNTKIYCGDHNKWLGVHVEVLQAQLLAINALLKIQPDRGDPKPVQAQDASGQRYELLGNEVVPIEKPVDEILDDLVAGKLGALRITPGHLRRLKRRAEERHIKCDFEGVERQSEDVGTLNIEMRLGSEDGFRAIAYIALTFVAHHWPEKARGPGLNSLKSMICSGPRYKGADAVPQASAPSEFVTWCAQEETIQPLLTSDLTHAIATSVNAGELIVYVALYDTFRFKVFLGSCDHPDATVLTIVDPRESHYEKDWQITYHDSALLSRQRDHAYLRDQAVGAGQGQIFMDELLEKVGKQQSRDLHEELSRVLRRGPRPDYDEAEKWLQTHRGIVVNLIRDIAITPPINSVGKIAVAAAQYFLVDHGDGNGTPESNAMLTAIISDMVKTMRNAVLRDEFTFDAFERLLLGRPGHELVFNQLIKVH